MKKYYLAIDIGASSGRHILGCVDDGRICLEEIYRFENGMKSTDDGLVWDTEALFSEETVYVINKEVYPTEKK